MFIHRTRTIFAHLLLGPGAAGVLATGADHLYEYTAHRSSSLFGFTDYGFRATIVVAIVAESIAIMTLTGHLALSGVHVLGSPAQRRTH
jgi:hypothetical protein